MSGAALVAIFLRKAFIEHMQSYMKCVIEHMYTRGQRLFIGVFLIAVTW